MKDKLSLFLKGMLMGICDIIPGISGGTIAFITGIYTRLISAVKALSPKLIGDSFICLFKRDMKSFNELKKDIKEVDIVFLIVLGAGIGIAFLLMSRIVKYLLESQFNYTISFFIGLILASSKVIFDNIRNHKMKNISVGIIGLAIGILLTFLIPVNITPNLGYILMAGFFAISAMFLPGISGAFILLIMGVYEFLLEVLHNLIENLSYFIAFIIGAVLGAFSISRLVDFLFKKDKCKTLYFLLGLVIGCLSIPVRNIADNGILGAGQGLIMILLAGLGMFIVSIVSKLEKVSYDK